MGMVRNMQARRSSKQTFPTLRPTVNDHSFLALTLTSAGAYGAGLR